MKNKLTSIGAILFLFALGLLTGYMGAMGTHYAPTNLFLTLSTFTVAIFLLFTIFLIFLMIKE